MQHPDLTYASATSLQAARREAAEARRRARRARTAPEAEELPAQLLRVWMYLAGHAAERAPGREAGLCGAGAARCAEVLERAPQPVPGDAA